MDTCICTYRNNVSYIFSDKFDSFMWFKCKSLQILLRQKFLPIKRNKV